MSLPKRYDPNAAEHRLRGLWEALGVYHFSDDAQSEVYSIDTPLQQYLVFSTWDTSIPIRMLM